MVLTKNIAHHTKPKQETIKEKVSTIDNKQNIKHIKHNNFWEWGMELSQNRNKPKHIWPLL